MFSLFAVEGMDYGPTIVIIHIYIALEVTKSTDRMPMITVAHPFSRVENHQQNVFTQRLFYKIALKFWKMYKLNPKKS